jgi:multisubunit Na+/H+ antiporter MnhF subunit
VSNANRFLQVKIFFIINFFNGNEKIFLVCILLLFRTINLREYAFVFKQLSPCSPVIFTKYLHTLRFGKRRI